MVAGLAATFQTNQRRQSRLLYVYQEWEQFLDSLSFLTIVPFIINREYDTPIYIYRKTPIRFFSA